MKMLRDLLRGPRLAPGQLAAKDRSIEFGNEQMGQRRRLRQVRPWHFGQVALPRWRGLGQKAVDLRERTVLAVRRRTDNETCFGERLSGDARGCEDVAFGDCSPSDQAPAMAGLVGLEEPATAPRRRFDLAAAGHIGEAQIRISRSHRPGTNKACPCGGGAFEMRLAGLSGQKGRRDYLPASATESPEAPPLAGRTRARRAWRSSMGVMSS